MPAFIENEEPGAARPSPQCSRFTLKNLKGDTYGTRRPVIDSFASADTSRFTIAGRLLWAPCGVPFFSSDVQVVEACRSRHD